MSTRNSIDKFGRNIKTQHIIIKERIGLGLKLSQDGDYDMQSRRLINVGKPNKSTDSATVAYVDNVSIRMEKNVATSAQEVISKCRQVEQACKSLLTRIDSKLALFEKEIKDIANTVISRYNALEEGRKSIELVMGGRVIILEEELKRLKSYGVKTTTSSIRM